MIWAITSPNESGVSLGRQSYVSKSTFRSRIDFKRALFAPLGSSRSCSGKTRNRACPCLRSIDCAYASSIADARRSGFSRPVEAREAIRTQFWATERQWVKGSSWAYSREVWSRTLLQPLPKLCARDHQRAVLTAVAQPPQATMPLLPLTRASPLLRPQQQAQQSSPYISPTAARCLG